MDDLYFKIGQRMQDLRRLHHLTQENLAEQMEVSVKHISAVERGASSFSLDKLIHLCEILDCTIDYLVLGREVSETNCYIPQSILDIFARSSDEERQLLQEYLLFFKKMRY